MRYRITSHDPAVGHWVFAQMNSIYHPDDMRCLGLWRGEEIIAGIVYQNWNGRSMMCHMVGSFLTPAFLAAIFDYPYHIVQVHKFICQVSSANTTCIRFVEHLGFTLEATLAEADPKGDTLLYTMTRPQCRFIAPRYRSRLEVHSGKK